MNETLVQSLTQLEMARRERQELNDRVMAATGLTLNQSLVLSEVEHAGGRATVSSLAATLGRAVHTLTSAVNGLERKGLVSRGTMHGEDKRIIRIAVTPEGAQALRRFRGVGGEVLSGMDTQRTNGAADDVMRAVDALLRLLAPAEVPAR